MNKTKKQRVETVNKIIEKIANTGRGFFYYDGRISRIEIRKGGHLYWYNSYTEETGGLNHKTKRKPKCFTNGSTLWALVLDMVEFVATGEQANSNNGFGGLYCSHWGYSEDEMLEIQNLAKKVGYLK